ncbi:hypothetical protein Q4512_06630 [Oceanihabitans sp. 2_MG-2023]|uniref:hypothetical protein n=1 Tax=Oceanihabitans sp. 2_MG-2023 TaxID=3062661 RepID=UPI0026E1DE82|nr:hypothetical protein [Oceanihabitans sp. 2_MG-2023]MDO6596583.1 hypothetical protein [Oceanihabitans sp. 2_MG-2023]
MKKLLFIAFLSASYSLSAQNNSELKKHYEAYYEQMKLQGDVQGVINGLTHLNIIDPSTARNDTLAYIYMSENKYMQALNTIGVDFVPSDSDMALEVKAISLKSISQPELAIQHFNEMFKRTPNVNIAYELAELNLSTQKFAEANKHITYGITNATSEMQHAYYETKTPYQVSLKAAFLYLKAMLKFNENKATNLDAAVTILEEAIALNPNFNLALISKNALLAQKTQNDKKN